MMSMKIMTVYILRKYKIDTNINLENIGHKWKFTLKVIIENYMKYFKLYGPTMSTWLFRVPIVIISDPKHLKIVLNNENCLDKEKRYQFARPVFGNGLIVAPAKLWKRNRKIINPTLNQKILESFVPTFVKYSELMMKELENDVQENKPFDVDQLILRYSMDILIETSMGIDEEIPRPANFLTDLHRLSCIIVERTFKVWLHPDRIFRLSPLGREFYKLKSKMELYFMKILEKKYNQFHTQDKDVLSFDDNKKQPFLDHLMSVGDKFSIEDIKHEVIVFLTAGVDTTSVAMGYLFICLAVHQDIQEKVFQELLDVFGEDERPICVEDLSKLQYLERVIKESLRIFPSVPFFARNVVEDIDIEDYIIPKGVSVIIPVVATHQNEKLWPDPSKFDPDRFLPSEVAKRHPYSYLPFSGGPRNCIGKTYAMMSMKIMSVYILRKYRITTDIKLEDIRAVVQIVARVIGGANISIQRRHRA